MNKKLKFADAHQLTDHLWIGGELDPHDNQRAHRQVDELAGVGIDAIIDCRIERDDTIRVTESQPQIDYLHIGVEGAGLRMPDDWFDDGTTYAIDQIEHGHVVLVHCRLGINRGPSMAYAIMLAQGGDPIDALEQIRSTRPVARIAYAEDAITWWMRMNEAHNSDVVAQLRRVRDWRSAEGLPRRSDLSAFKHAGELNRISTE